MDFHLENGVRLHTESKYKNLYKWAINERDAQGKIVGADQVPWAWNLWSTGTSCTLSDSIDLRSGRKFQQTEQEASLEQTIEQRRVIRIQLRSGTTGSDGKDFRAATTFSMF